MRELRLVRDEKHCHHWRWRPATGKSHGGWGLICSWDPGSRLALKAIRKPRMLSLFPTSYKPSQQPGWQPQVPAEDHSTSGYLPLHMLHANLPESSPDTLYAGKSDAHWLVFSMDTQDCSPNSYRFFTMEETMQFAFFLTVTKGFS